MCAQDYTVAKDANFCGKKSFNQKYNQHFITPDFASVCQLLKLLTSVQCDQNKRLHFYFEILKSIYGRL